MAAPPVARRTVRIAWVPSPIGHPVARAVRRRSGGQRASTGRRLMKSPCGKRRAHSATLIAGRARSAVMTSSS
jgi:hypothetical protein